MAEQPILLSDQNTFRHYIFFWLGQLTSLLGSSVVNFALIWWITIESQSATILSLAFFLSLLPQIFISLIAGVYIDRWDRKKIIFISDLSQAIISFGLVLIFLFNIQSVWLVLGMMVFRNLFQAVHQPTVAAIIPVMIPKDKLSRMNSLNMIASSAIMTIGPIVSGILIGFMEIATILWIDIGTFIIAFIPIIFIKIPSVVDRSKPKQGKPSFKQEIKEGYQIIMTIKGMFAFFALAVIGNFFISPQGVLRPYFISIYHQGSAKILSYISALVQVGMIAGALVIALRKKWKHKSRFIIIAQFMIGSGLLISALAPEGNFLIIGIGLFIFSFGIPITNSLYMTILQEKVPLDKQGRVSSIDLALSYSIMPISSLIAGPLAELLGVNVFFIILSGIFLLIVLAFTLFTDMRDVDKDIILSQNN